MVKQYTNQFNSDVLRDLKKIDEEIENSETPEEVNKLRLAKLYRGMELTSGFFRYNGFKPY